MPQDDKKSPKEAFETFRARIKQLSDRQNKVFASIMKRIDTRKLQAARQKLNSTPESETDK